MKPGFIRIKLIELDPAPLDQHLLISKCFAEPLPLTSSSMTNNTTSTSRAAAAKHSSMPNKIHLEPYCAVNIKELIREPTKTQFTIATVDKKTHRAMVHNTSVAAADDADSATTSSVAQKSTVNFKLVQNKPTFYPKWNTCFDCHLYKGRMIQIIIKNNKNKSTLEQLAEATISAESLAFKAKEKLTFIDWVLHKCHIFY